MGIYLSLMAVQAGMHLALQNTQHSALSSEPKETNTIQYNTIRSYVAAPGLSQVLSALSYCKHAREPVRQPHTTAQNPLASLPAKACL